MILNFQNAKDDGEFDDWEPSEQEKWEMAENEKQFEHDLALLRYYAPEAVERFLEDNK